MAPPSPSASGQTLDRLPSSPSSSDLHHTPASPEPHISNMSPIKEEPVAIASASALESKKPTQAGFPFLSLPPEIRNMIYNYVFTPVRDGLCWTIYVDYARGDRLRGYRRQCILCHTKRAHSSCRNEFRSMKGMLALFDLGDNYTLSGILQTCHAILAEASPISLSHMHISLCSWMTFPGMYSLHLKSFMEHMRQPQGAYFKKLTFIFCDQSTNKNEMAFVDFLNSLDVRIGHLEIQEFYPLSKTRSLVERFVDLLSRLKNQPATVACTTGYDHPAYRSESTGVELNKAAGNWLTMLATAKSAELNARLPLLRDFLPQYFDQSSD